MKRTLLGVGALVLVVGLGSAGVYAVHREFVAGPPAATEAEPAPIASSRDMTPIRVASQASDMQPSAANPFATEARQPQSVAVSEDRYGNRIRENERNDSTGRRTLMAEDQPEGDIPDADQLTATDAGLAAPRGRAAVGRRPRSPATRYAEQTVAAELPADDQDAPSEQFAPAEEPQPVRGATKGQQVDRYGRRLAADRIAEEPEPAAQEPVAEEQPAIEPQQATEDAQPIPAASDPQGSIDEGTGRPGDPQLSGSQAPSLTIEKTAPPEIQIGKPAKFVIKVRNAGSATAQGVEIHDTIPQGTQLIDTSPPAKRGAQGGLVWELAALKPGEEQKVELQLMPTAEGEIGSVATVHFRAEASVRTLATKPMLTMEITGPSKVMKGDEVTLKIKLSNPGTGAATGVVLNEAIPEGLSHAAGKDLEFEVGTLKPGETRELELALMATAAGPVTNIVSAQGEANLQVEARAELEVIAPQLQVSLTGPKRRYLERNAVYNLSVSNPGTAAAKDIELVAVLPKELKFVEANNGGQFDAATHSVYWGLEELPPQESGTVTLTTLPLQPGEAKLLIKGTAKQGLADQHEEILAIEGLAAINFQLSDVADPIEAGGETTYEVRVTNQGSKAATNVRVVALLPREMKAISAEGPVRYVIEGQRVVFEPLKQLAPKADTPYTIKVKGLEPGDLRMRVQITTDDIQEPITREESTRVFGSE